MQLQTFSDYLEDRSQRTPDEVWLRDLPGEQAQSWTWRQAFDEIRSVAAWLEDRYPTRTSMAILSRNRSHWFLADMAVIASGNVTIPLFTTLSPKTAEYILGFSEAKVLFLGEADNWQPVRAVVPEDTTVVCFPGVEIDDPHLRWNDLLAEATDAKPRYACSPADLISLIFTSGTTGVPKGVMQTHESMIIPVERFKDVFGVRESPRFLSYLPLSHIAERQLIETQSLVRHGPVSFNESLPTLLRDVQSVKPNFFFGVPRVWEQLQQGIIAKIGSQQAIDKALAADREGTQAKIRDALGLGDADYCLSGGAPIPPTLLEWFARVGIRLLEGFGQTEAMGLVANLPQDFRVGSIGKPGPGVECRLSEDDELLVRATGLSPGYYKMPEQTAELIRDGWWHTGDKARIDEDGFIYITGRVKEYFKTIHGKFVAPPPIESAFADNPYTAQLCLLGRGYSKTVMVCVLCDQACKADRDEVERALRDRVAVVNNSVEHHARIGAVIVAAEPWTIENEVLTPTMKIRREQIEGRFGELARDLARQAAEQGEIFIRWTEGA